MVDKCIEDKHKKGARGEQGAMEHAIGLDELLKLNFLWKTNEKQGK